MHDLAVIIVSTNEADWLRRCLPTVFAGAGDLDIDVAVVDNGSSGATRAVVEDEFPLARVVDSENHGFPHANNRALMTVDARYVLFLNPDTEIVHGSLEDLVRRMDACPEVGLAGCRQVGPDGQLHATMRRFPTPIRLLLEALGSERWPFRASWTGQRYLKLADYAREFDLDWTTGSFMLVRREALESAGWMDERFFLYCDDPDLALKIKRAGWIVRHLPQMEIVHHADKMGWSARGYRQYAFANRIYFTKHFGSFSRRAAIAAAAAGYGIRAVAFPFVRRSEPDAARAMRGAFATVIGRVPAPYEPPPAVAVRLRPQVGVGTQSTEENLAIASWSVSSDHPSQGFASNA
ncbi:MAG: glycosyltransferase family 2 protein [Solirubrobacteraceae bacterium]